MRASVAREVGFDATDFLVELAFATLQVDQLPPKIIAVRAQARFGCGAAREPQRCSEDYERHHR